MEAQAVDPLLHYISTIGFGGVFGLLVFRAYREDRRASEDRIRHQAEESETRLGRLAESYREIVQENTRAVTELTTFLRGEHR